MLRNDEQLAYPSSWARPVVSISGEKPKEKHVENPTTSVRNTSRNSTVYCNHRGTGWDFLPTPDSSWHPGRNTCALLYSSPPQFAPIEGDERVRCVWVGVEVERIFHQGSADAF